MTQGDEKKKAEKAPARGDKNQTHREMMDSMLMFLTHPLKHSGAQWEKSRHMLVHV